jgi:hypothetical protein
MAYMHPGKLRRPINIESGTDAGRILDYLKSNFTYDEIESCVVWWELSRTYGDATGKCAQEIDATSLSEIASFVHELVGAKQPETPEGADADRVQGEGKQRRAKGRNKGAGGKPPLEKSNRLKFQVYERIKREHQPGNEYCVVIERLKKDRQFMEQLSDTKLKLTSQLVTKALAYFSTQQKRNQGRNKQQTDQT